ncbi:hypothetical protein D3C76_1402060 [compost metagenome]
MEVRRGLEPSELKLNGCMRCMVHDLFEGGTLRGVHQTVSQKMLMHLAVKG